MSRKQPEIKVIYPDASTTAMLLTEAMIKRSSGKRVVETNSEEREYTGQELFSRTLACKTDTSVELTLRLNPDAMDYALTTLIAKNLTEEERRAIRMETDSMELLDLLSPHAGEAAGASTCTDEGKPSTAEVRSAPLADEAIEVGRFTERALRDILNEMIDTMEKGHGTFDAVNHAIWAIKELAKASRREVVAKEGKPIEEDPGLVDQLAVLICGAQRVTQKCTTPLKLFATDVDHYIKESFDDDEAEYVITARELARVLSDVQGNFAEDPKLTLEKALKIRAKARVAFEKLKNDLGTLNKKEPSWDDVEAAARQIGKKKCSNCGHMLLSGKCDKLNLPMHPDNKCGSWIETDKTDEDAADQEIEPGLLRDLDEDKSSTAEVRSAPLADKEGEEDA